VQTSRVSQSRFTAHWAFVVQVAAAEPGVADPPLGRAEHVVSGTAAHFATWAELVAFIEQVLASGACPHTSPS
jgi:hypothetical protein